MTPSTRSHTKKRPTQLPAQQQASPEDEPAAAVKDCLATMRARLLNPGAFEDGDTAPRSNGHTEAEELALQKMFFYDASLRGPATLRGFTQEEIIKRGWLPCPETSICSRRATQQAHLTGHKPRYAAGLVQFNVKQGWLSAEPRQQEKDKERLGNYMPLYEDIHGLHDAPVLANVPTRAQLGASIIELEERSREMFERFKALGKPSRMDTTLGASTAKASVKVVKKEDPKKR